VSDGGGDPIYVRRKKERTRNKKKAERPEEKGKRGGEEGSKGLRDRKETRRLKSRMDAKEITNSYEGHILLPGSS